MRFGGGGGHKEEDDRWVVHYALGPITYTHTRIIHMILTHQITFLPVFAMVHGGRRGHLRIA